VTRAYLDASAIVKLACAEPESAALARFLAPPMEAATSAIAEVEVPRALGRLGFHAGEARAVLGALYVIGVDAAVRTRAATLAPLALRTLDAIHLATALELGATGLQVVTYDDRFARAARSMGLTVVTPGREG
jgi:predicted nucleic acid-binding protein